MRAVLTKIYAAAGAAAAVFLAGIAALITAQIAARLLGMHLPASDDIAGWLMAASVFLALPYALTKGDHIRVTLLTSKLPQSWGHYFEILTALFGVGLTGFMAYNALAFVYNSYALGDVAMGELAVPMWIPQLPLAVGFLILFVAFVDFLVRVLCGQVGIEKAHEAFDATE
jgi:TRAP-type C4-dicarboxylate transport system permease small subunit